MCMGVILAAMAGGVLFGTLFPSLRPDLAAYGKLFMALLQMCALPMLILNLISAPRRLFGEGIEQNIRTGLRFFLCYLLNMAMAASAGIAAAIILRPGRRLRPEALEFIDKSFAASADALAGTAGGEASVMSFLFRIVPENIFSALNAGNMASIMFFCLFAGTALARIAEEPRRMIFTFLDGVESAITGVLGWCLKLLPLGMFCVLGGENYTSDTHILASLGGFGAVLLVCYAFLLVVYALIFIRCSGRGTLAGLRDLARPFLVAFGTQSSLASLPVVREVLGRQTRLNQENAGFSAAIAITLNPSGGVAFYTAASVFLMQVYETPPTVAAFFIVFVGGMMAGMSAVTIAGVAALGAISIVAEALSLPYTPVVYLLTGVYAFLDSAITAVNVVANTAVSALLGRASFAKGSGNADPER